MLDKLLKQRYSNMRFVVCILVSLQHLIVAARAGTAGEAGNLESNVIGNINSICVITVHVDTSLIAAIQDHRHLSST